jgi:hypothetical protein
MCDGRMIRLLVVTEESRRDKRSASYVVLLSLKEKGWNGTINEGMEWKVNILNLQFGGERFCSNYIERISSFTLSNLL